MKSWLWLTILVASGCGYLGTKKDQQQQQEVNPVLEEGGCSFKHDYGLLKGVELCEYGPMPTGVLNRQYCVAHGGVFLPDLCPKPRIAQCLPASAATGPITVLYDSEQSQGFAKECEARGGRVTS